VTLDGPKLKPNSSKFLSATFSATLFSFFLFLLQRQNTSQRTGVTENNVLNLIINFSEMKIEMSEDTMPVSRGDQQFRLAPYSGSITWRGIRQERRNQNSGEMKIDVRNGSLCK
jgi:hypothetical protein